MGEAFLAGIRVADLSEPSGWLCGRILSDLGADVALVPPPGGYQERAPRAAFAALNAGKRAVTEDDPSKLMTNADVVVASHGPDLDLPPALVWCAITPFGLTGPKAGRRASDLSVLAQAGTMFMTGEPGRAPLRCTFPTSWYHGGAEAAAAVLAALHQRASTGRGQLVDVSLQETHLMATMGRSGAVGLGGTRGSRAGALMRVGRTTQREIWACKDGFVSFGLRGGPARIPGLKRLVAWMAEEGMASPALTDRDWDSYTHTTLSPDDVDAISEPIAAFLKTKTMTELYDAALERGLMLAPANTAREILASRQYNSRDVFIELEDPELGRITVPRRFVVSEGAPGVTRPVVEERGAAFAPRSVTSPENVTVAEHALSGLNVLEFGAGAAGPLSIRYFADHGATVVRIESRKRPDFLRLYAITAEQKSLDASPMFATFNANKLGVTLNMKHPDARAIALRLVEWADVVAENFAPGAMGRWGLAYQDLRSVKPDLVMISTCLHGQTGPEKDYPGFGGQGSALSGFNHLTGWPDREPLGPYGTITDSLAPRFAAAAVMAALLRRKRTGEGAYLDLSQVECAVYSLGETIVEASLTGEPPGRLGNRSRDAAPHGAFRCTGDDRWIAIAIWNDEEWKSLAREAGLDDRRFASNAQRLENVDELEQDLEAWTGTQDRDALAERLQEVGLDAWSVQDLEDCFNDPQLAHRGHFVPMEHRALGTHVHETLGFRLSDSPPRFTRPGPTLGRDNEEVYKGILRMSDDEYERLKADGVFD
jgi:crotonobetainyl-CoA:carnitine CoA-transferase CaiB-like acyl-CoA transferase